MNRKDLFVCSEKNGCEASARCEAKPVRKKWISWVPIIVCLCILAAGFLFWQNQKDKVISNCSPLHEDKIYPTVMIGGKLYEWRRGASVCEEMPEDCLYYRQVMHVVKEKPERDCEFASVFSVSGDIFTIPGGECAYLRLSMDWMTDRVIIFDLVKTG